MSRHLFMGPEAYETGNALPVLLTHREWCRHLRERGILDPKHRRCTMSGSCVASAFKKTGQSWRYHRESRRVSR